MILRLGSWAGRFRVKTGHGLKKAGGKCSVPLVILVLMFQLKFQAVLTIVIKCHQWRMLHNAQKK